MLIAYPESGKLSSSKFNSSLAKPADAEELCFYEYVRSDPVNMIDPTGLEAVKFSQPAMNGGSPVGPQYDFSSWSIAGNSPSPNFSSVANNPYGLSSTSEIFTSMNRPIVAPLWEGGKTGYELGPDEDGGFVNEWEARYKAEDILWMTAGLEQYDTIFNPVGQRNGKYYWDDYQRNVIRDHWAWSDGETHAERWPGAFKEGLTNVITTGAYSGKMVGVWAFGIDPGKPPTGSWYDNADKHGEIGAGAAFASDFFKVYAPYRVATARPFVPRLAEEPAPLTTKTPTPNRVTQYYEPAKGPFPVAGKYALSAKPSVGNRLVDGIHTETTWIAPHPASKMNQFRRFMTGVGRRRNYVEFDAAPNELVMPNNTKILYGRYQQMIYGKVDLTSRNPIYGVSGYNYLDPVLRYGVPTAGGLGSGYYIMKQMSDEP